MSRPNRTIISIPPELLGLVITHASRNEPSAPLRLAAVSRAFHRVAMSTPGAWTKLFLRITSGDTDDALWLAIQKAKRWFQRSGACSVDVFIEMEQGFLPSISAPSHPSSISGLDRGCEGDEDADIREAWGILLLPHVLSRFHHRIRSLKLHTTSPEEAQVFFDAVYPPPPFEFEPYDLPLEGLVVVAASDGIPNARTGTHIDRMPTAKVRLLSGSISDALCRNNFPHLGHLEFVNIPLQLYPVSSPQSIEDPGSDSPSPSPMLPLPRLLSADTGHRLRSLSIVYPVRFAPILLCGLLDALRVTPALEKLEVEGRFSPGGTSHHQQNHGATPVQGPVDAGSVSASHSDQLSMTLSSSAATQTSVSTSAPSPSVTSPSNSSSSTSPHTSSAESLALQSRPLLALPCLSFLALKANGLPAILSSLVLPNLRELRIDDMDANRPPAAYETAEALRGLMVRGDMPLDGLHTTGDAGSNQHGSEKAKEEPKGGLQVLHMCNISLRHPRGISAVPLSGGVSGPHSDSQVATHRSPAHLSHSKVNEDDTEAALWSWCFRRMIYLRELRAENMDFDVLLGYITPPLHSARSSRNLRPRLSTSDDGCRLRQGKPHTFTGDIFCDGAYSMFKQEMEMKTQTRVEIEPLPRLKRLTLANFGSMPTWLGNGQGVDSSPSPLAGNAWIVDQAFTSASIRVFKARRPDIVVENASTRPASAPSASRLQSVFRASHTGPVDYLSLYLQ